MMNSRQKIGRRISALRAERGLSQRQFAMMISMDRTYLSGVESGRRNVTVTTLERIADGFGVSLEELFKGIR